MKACLDTGHVCIMQPVTEIYETKGSFFSQWIEDWIIWFQTWVRYKMIVQQAENQQEPWASGTEMDRELLSVIKSDRSQTAWRLNMRAHTHTHTPQDTE